MSLRPFWSGGSCNPEPEERPHREAPKRSTKDLFKMLLEKITPKALRERRPHREDLKKITKVLFKVVVKKRPAK